MTQAEIAHAYELIRPHVRRTPTMDVERSDFGLPPGRITLKLELFQHTGSFKARGAVHNLLSRDVPAAGVVAASGGNHGVAVAFAAMKAGKPASIFVPTVASPAKVERIRSYGARLVITGERYDDSLRASREWAAESGALEVHAYDDPATLAGAGTTGLEIEEQAPDLDTLLIAVGGGGLIGGIASWYAGRVRIVAVEPERAPTLSWAMAAGRPVDAPAEGVAADSLAPKRVGDVTFPIARKFVDQVALVTDEAIVAAQQTLWSTVRVMAEPGGAAAMAALLSGVYVPTSTERVGVVVCGGNVVLQ